MDWCSNNVPTRLARTTAARTISNSKTATGNASQFFVRVHSAHSVAFWSHMNTLVISVSANMVLIGLATILLLFEFSLPGAGKGKIPRSLPPSRRVRLKLAEPFGQTAAPLHVVVSQNKGTPI